MLLWARQIAQLDGMVGKAVCVRPPRGVACAQRRSGGTQQVTGHTSVGHSRQSTGNEAQGCAWCVRGEQVSTVPFAPGKDTRGLRARRSYREAHQRPKGRGAEGRKGRNPATCSHQARADAPSTRAARGDTVRSTQAKHELRRAARAPRALQSHHDAVLASALERGHEHLPDARAQPPLRRSVVACQLCVDCPEERHSATAQVAPSREERGFRGERVRAAVIGARVEAWGAHARHEGAVEAVHWLPALVEVIAQRSGGDRS
mmetsp:Transcript_10684/g.31731  ORF Transcript_10684/g.31731 Transcript_10684/m.31731 type:complete len:261 (-) Transcript_10684:95-877(-)